MVLESRVIDYGRWARDYRRWGTGARAAVERGDLMIVFFDYSELQDWAFRVPRGNCCMVTAGVRWKFTYRSGRISYTLRARGSVGASQGVR